MPKIQAPPTEATAGPVLGPEIRAAIEAFYPRYPTRRAVVLPALHIVDERLGYVPLEAVVEIAQMLGLDAGPGAGHAQLLSLLSARQAPREVQGLDVPID